MIRIAQTGIFDFIPMPCYDYGNGGHMAGKRKELDEQYSAHFLIYMTAKQKAEVKAKCERIGTSVSQTVRDFFDKFLKE